LAISLPGIVLDVARAIQPSGVEAVRAEFARRAGSATSAAAGVFPVVGEGKAGTAVTESEQSKTPESFKKFEAMVLQTFIQNMLPKEGTAVYGKGVAGDMWKSLLAEKVADVMAERGGIGISDRVLGDHYAKSEKTSTHKPKSSAD
jgi:hypothetical protein